MTTNFCTDDLVTKEQHRESGYESNLQPDIVVKSQPKMHLDGTFTISKYEKCEEHSQSKEFFELIVPGSSYEASLLECKLAKDTRTMQFAFAELRENTFRKLCKSCRFKLVLQHVKRLVDIGEHNVKTYEELEDVLCQSYCSWFNYDILKEVRRKFLYSGGKSDKALQNYEETFFSYCKRRCFKSPCTFHPKPASTNLKSLVFKIDECFDEYTLKDVLKIRSTVIDVIQCPEYAVYVRSVQEGCVEVSCNILPQAAVSHLNQSQISQLRRNDIVSFKIENEELMEVSIHS